MLGLLWPRSMFCFRGGRCRGAWKSAWGGWGPDHGSEWKLYRAFPVALAGLFEKEASSRFEKELSELVECAGQLSEAVPANLSIGFGDDDIREMSNRQPEHSRRPSPTPDISGGFVCSPDMLLDITEERGNPSLGDGIRCRYGALNKSVDGWAGGASEMSEGGMAARCK
jgi:hypothetical protein